MAGACNVIAPTSMRLRRFIAMKAQMLRSPARPAGRGEEAITVLKQILIRHSDDRDTLLALISFTRDAGDFGTALAYAERLARVTPR